MLAHPAGKVITFHTETQIPIPNPQYLALHAACAKVMHMTAMAKAVDEFLEDWEATPVLAEDGSSADLLAHAFTMV
jgi:hypothetical protein